MLSAGLLTRASWGDGVMAPPPLPHRRYALGITSSQVTEDTPPDLLEGTMDLQVSLPSGKKVIMNVHRSTPMMDLLVQVTTTHRINPGNHVIQVISDNIFLSYKASTPIGTLDTNAIKIVPKNKLKEASKIRKSNLQQEAVERNIRLKVNLPRNQLAVYRVPPRTLISEVLNMVCVDKNLDPDAHEVRHPVNIDERLRGSCSLSDYQLQEVCIVTSDFRPPPLSVTDLITMASIAHPEDKKRRGFLGGIFSRKAKSSTGDSSVSSGSAGERSVSPARSDESADGGRPTPRALSPASSSGTLTNVNFSTNNKGSSVSNGSGSSSGARISRPVSMISITKIKKRPAPIPPQSEPPKQHEPVHKESNKDETKTNLSRHSSDSSGYHEADTKSSYTSYSTSEVSSLEVTKTCSLPANSNLGSVISSSNLSIASSRGKRKAPPPPPKVLPKTGPLAITEEDLDSGQDTSKNTLESTSDTTSEVSSQNSKNTTKYVGSSEGGISAPDSPEVEVHEKHFSESGEGSQFNPSPPTAVPQESSNYSEKGKIHINSSLEEPDRKIVTELKNNTHNEKEYKIRVEPENNSCVEHENDSDEELKNKKIENNDSIKDRLKFVETNDDPLVDTSKPSSVVELNDQLNLSIESSQSSLEVNKSNLENTPVEASVKYSVDAFLGKSKETVETYPSPSPPASLSENINSSAALSPSSHLLHRVPPKSYLMTLNEPLYTNVQHSSSPNSTAPKSSNKNLPLKSNRMLGLNDNHTTNKEASVKNTSSHRLNPAIGIQSLPRSHLVNRSTYLDISSSNNAITSDLKGNTLPSSVKRKKIGIYSNFRSPFQPHIQTQHSKPIDSSLNSTNSKELLNQNQEKNALIGTRKVGRQNAVSSDEDELDLDMKMFEQQSILSSEVNEGSISRMPSNISQSIPQSLLPQNSIFFSSQEAVEKNDSEMLSSVPVDRPIPVPRKKLNRLNLSEVEIKSEERKKKINSDLSRKIFLEKIIDEGKDFPENGNLIVKEDHSKVHFPSPYFSPALTDEDFAIPLSKSSSNPRLMEVGGNYLAEYFDQLGSGLKSWKTTESLEILNEGSQKTFPVNSTFNSLAGTRKDYPTRLRTARNSSLVSNSDNEEMNSRTVSLSSETSNISVEGEIQILRPERHKKQKTKINEKEKELVCPNDSSCSDFSKNLERVDETTNQNVSIIGDTYEEAFDVHGIIEIAQSVENRHPEVVNEGLTAEDLNKEAESKIEKPIMYVELQNQGESSTDPTSPTNTLHRKPVYTSKVQLSFGDEEESSVNELKMNPGKMFSLTSMTADELTNTQENIIRQNIIDELKSAIETSATTHQPRIVNLKPKMKDSNSLKKSEYNVVLSIGNKYNSTKYAPSAEPFTRSSSSSSYESTDSKKLILHNAINQRKSSRSSTENSYETAPPPLPESQVPNYSDPDSRGSLSSSVSRQSSFSDFDGKEVLKPRVPAFSISTYQSRAERISYDKKLSRSESLTSFKEINGGSEQLPTSSYIPDRGMPEWKKLNRTDYQKNKFYRSQETINKNSLWPKETSEWNGKAKNEEVELTRTLPNNVQSKSIIFNFKRSELPKNLTQDNIKFELGSAKDPASSSYAAPNASKLRKAKSTFDVRSADNRMPEGFQALPDSGLANEYMRLQDDFMKWQQQLLQNQHVLHSRVAPIAANPPTLSGMNPNSQSASGLVVGPNQSQIQPRKPVEITIPIRFEDDDEIIEPKVQIQPQINRQQNQTQRVVGQTNQMPYSNLSWDGAPSVQVGSWRERPTNTWQDARSQSELTKEPSPPFSASRPFFKPSSSSPTAGMQTVFQSVPQANFQPFDQSSIQPTSQSRFQQPTQPKFQQVDQSRFQQADQPRFQPPEPSRFQQPDQSRFQQPDQSRFQQPDQSRFQQPDQSSFPKVPQSNIQFSTRAYPQPSADTGANKPQMTFVNGSSTTPRAPSAERNIDDNINARFTSVVTLSNDKTGQNAPQKDKVRSIVQLNNTDSQLQSTPVPKVTPFVRGFQKPEESQTDSSFGTNFTSNANKSPPTSWVSPNSSTDGEKRSPSTPPSSGISSMAPMSSRLVQQAVQQPATSTGYRVSPPRSDQKSMSPPKHEVSPPPFAGVTLRPVESRVSPPKNIPYVSSAPVSEFAPPPPPPPPSGVPPPPPPPVGDRRTSTGKKIVSSNNVPQLDAREELMMAIRQFGGSNKLRKSPHPQLQ